LTRDEITQKKYALKRIVLNFEEQEKDHQISSVNQFNEITICQNLNHENILKIEKFFIEKKFNETHIMIVRYLF
jgi:serine/threonine protein kinase